MSVFRLFLIYLRIGIQNELQYRANFFVQCLTSLVEVAAVLWELSIVFSQTATLGGWHPEELRALVGVFFIVGGTIHVVISPSMQRLMEDVRQGTLDYAILKPVDAQMLVSLRQFEIWKMFDVLLGVGILGQALWQMSYHFALNQVAIFALVLFCGMVVVVLFLADAGDMYVLVREDGQHSAHFSKCLRRRALAALDLSALAARGTYHISACGVCRDHPSSGAGRAPGPSDVLGVAWVGAGHGAGVALVLESRDTALFGSVGLVHVTISPVRCRVLISGAV